MHLSWRQQHMKPKVSARNEWLPWQKRNVTVKNKQINRSKDRKAFWYCLTQDHAVHVHCQLLFPRYLLAQLLSPSISYWCDSNLKCPPLWLSKLNVGQKKTSQHYNLHFASLRCVSSFPFVHIRCFSFRSRHASLSQPAVARGRAQQQPRLQHNTHYWLLQGSL